MDLIGLTGKLVDFAVVPPCISTPSPQSPEQNDWLLIECAIDPRLDLDGQGRFRPSPHPEELSIGVHGVERRVEVLLLGLGVRVVAACATKINLASLSTLLKLLPPVHGLGVEVGVPREGQVHAGQPVHLWAGQEEGEFGHGVAENGRTVGAVEHHSAGGSATQV